MIDTNYWYYGSIRNYILHTLRLFQNFCISEGKDEDGNDILRRIPCTFMSSDKSVVYMLNNGTDTVLESCPKMILSLSSVGLANDKISGAPYYAIESSFTEKKFDEDKGNYVYEPGNSYNITRLNPLPALLEFKLYILTSMLEQKLQLFEQIRCLFSPTLELQVSENPIDLSRVTSITLTNMNWSSKGTNLDGSTLDAMDLTFEVPINIDMPSLVQKQSMIEQITNSLSEGSNIEDLMSWELKDERREYHSPTRNDVELYVDEKVGCQRIRLKPSEICQNWYQLLNAYGIKYDKHKRNVYVNCLTNANIDKRNDISGCIVIDPVHPNEACYHAEESSLPQTNVKAVDAIIDPHYNEPSQTIGTRYLITDDISNCELWGTFINENDEPLTSNDKISKNSIIELTENGWKLSLDPLKSLGIYYIRDNSEPIRLYTYNNSYNEWVDVINKVYPVGFWRISEVKNWGNYENN